MSAPVAVVGHRGWPVRFPDNTLAGAMAAAEVADMIELDIRRSGDGKLVLAHDAELGGVPVSVTPWSELGEIELGDGHHPALLDEVLAALPEIPVQMEIKNLPMDPGFEPDHRLALEAAERARQGDVVTGFNPDSLAAVRRVFPEVDTGLAVPAWFDLDEAVKMCEDEGHTVLVPEHTLVTREINAGLSVYPWTVNDPYRALELAELGVAGIITDDPGLIAETLRSL